jgi:hypothetical protein
VATAVGPRAQRLARGSDERPAQSQSLPRLMPVKVLDRIRLIARTLEDEPGLTSPELAERVGFGRRHMSLVLLRLEEHGLVAHEGRRWFPGSEPVH